jgi:hypothetical protein
VIGRHRTRGDGVGIEVTDDMLRGVRLHPARDGRLATAAEVAIEGMAAESVHAGLVLLKAELGETGGPTRIATFPAGAMLQRSDITGHSVSEVKDLRSSMRDDVTTTMVVDDGPRRWMYLIRWDEPRIEQLAVLARRAGFIDVALEPSPLSIARVADPRATYVSRLTAPGHAHHAVINNRLPVAGLSAVVTGRTYPDVDIESVPMTVEIFDDFMDDVTLAEALDRVARGVGNEAGGPATTREPVLDLAGVASTSFPDHDVRSVRRQAVSLGAAVGAAGLAGALHPLEPVGAGPIPDPLDRPWAIEALATDTQRRRDAPRGIERVTRRLRLRRSR